MYPGADRSFTIRVTNNEGAVVGKTIDSIRVNLPVSEAGIKLGSNAGTVLDPETKQAVSGFTATSTNLGDTQFNTYRGGRVLPGQSVDITFPATVGAPLAKDLLGDFRVQVSSNNFVTNTTAVGNLLAKVQVLELVAGGLKPFGPTNADNSKGVTDRSGTGGQAITYAAEVRNHSRSALDVVTNITSAAGDTGTPTTVSVPAGGTNAAQIPVKLAAATTDRSTVFVASAETATQSAVAPKRNDTFTVQAPAKIAFSDLTPTRVKSGAGSAVDFGAKAAKTGTPAVDVLRSTLTFGTNSSTATAPTFPGGASTQNVTYKFLSISGTDGALPTSVSTSVTDNNLASYSVEPSKLTDVVIDNIAPILTMNVALPIDADKDQQVAVKNGDAINVSGTIANAGDLANNSLRVVLTPDAGPAVSVPVTLSSATGESRTFSGSVSPTWDTKATKFTAAAEVLDVAGNSGTVSAAATTIDNTLPVMIGKGVVLSASTISVTFDDLTGVAGGCDPKMWLIDGTPGMVTGVKDATGGDCRTRDTGARTLTLRNALAVDQLPKVTYSPDGVRPASLTIPVKDGAANDAVRQTVETVSNLVPQAPQLLNVERRDGTATAPFEKAYQDPETKQFFTNVAGENTMRLTVGGIQKNYTLQVLKNGAQVASRTFTADPALGATTYSGNITFPMAAGDGLSSFTTRFVSAVGNIGETSSFGVVLDTVQPALGASTIDSSTVRMAFSERIVLGSDFADNWFVSETVDTETGTARRTVNVNSVTATDLSNRAFDVTLRDSRRFAGLDYFVQSGTRYEDRAGNTLVDTLKIGG